MLLQLLSMLSVIDRDNCFLPSTREIYSGRVKSWRLGTLIVELSLL